jgi:hypothetical protein
MPPTLLIDLFKVFGPIVADIIRRRQAAGDAHPTDAQIAADFEVNIEKYLQEGASWRANHPDA